MVEAHNNITTKTTERHPNLISHSTLGISHSRLGCGLCTIKSTRFCFVDKLTRGGRVVIDLVPIGTTTNKGRTVVLHTTTVLTSDVGGDVLVEITRLGHHSDNQTNYK